MCVNSLVCDVFDQFLLKHTFMHSHVITFRGYRYRIRNPECDDPESRIIFREVYSI